MKKYVLYVLAVFALMGSALTPALAQEAPTPHKMPRVPVHRESGQDSKPALPPSREVHGQAIVIDGERLRVGELDLRLFGIVPPQLSASFGPQARAALDELTTGQNVTCLIRDRDREGRFLATCRNASNVDLALGLLQRGLAVTARGSLASTEFAESYAAAEQTAMTQKTGLWSITVPVTAIPEIPKAYNAVVVQPPAEAVAPQVHPKPAEEKSAPVAIKSEQNQSGTATELAVKPVVPTVTPALSGNAVTYAAPPEPFLARYQLLVTGLVILTTALCLFGFVTIQRLRDRKAEMQAIAAALRGELMAAHAICRARLRSPVDPEDKDITWPRLRSTLYQAYVGRLGWLGAELARRVASIYGQASDYAAYYAGDDESRALALPKRQALQTLMQHIDDVLPRLAIIEHTGNASGAGIMPSRHTGVVVLPLSPQPVRPAIRGAAETASPALSPTKIWAAVQRLARKPWGHKKTGAARDPIAEYTALIEEEMKRFSFLEEDESEQRLSTTDPTAKNWPQQSA